MAPTPIRPLVHPMEYSTTTIPLKNHYAQLQWKAQNSMLHNKKSSYNTTKENLLAHISAAYTPKSKLLPQDHHPFAKSLNKWTQQPVSSMKLLLKRNLPYIQHCLQ
eukprot:4816792-Ditylum_brightwellii.AAC.1